MKKKNSNGEMLTPDSREIPAVPLRTKRGADETTLDPLVLLDALVAVRNGNFTVRLPSQWMGIYGRIADAFNDIPVKPTR